MNTRAIEQSKVAENSVRRAVILVMASACALGIPIAASFLTGSHAGALTGQVEAASSSASMGLAGIAALLPLGYATAAGMVTAVNPCGFTMLPAYLGLFLSDASDDTRAGLGTRLARALVVSSAMAAGFVALFAAAGLLISLGAHAVVAALPWIGLAVGVLLALAGAWSLSGGKLYGALWQQIAAHTGDPRRLGARSYFLFGVSYATASLSCTLPVFLTVVGTSLAAATLVGSLGQFVLCALGMALVITALTLSIAVFKLAFVRQLQRLAALVGALGPVLLLLAGAYLVYYWLTQGGLLGHAV